MTVTNLEGVLDLMLREHLDGMQRILRSPSRRPDALLLAVDALAAGVSEKYQNGKRIQFLRGVEQFLSNFDLQQNLKLSPYVHPRQYPQGRDAESIGFEYRGALCVAANTFVPEQHAEYVFVPNEAGLYIGKRF